MAKKLLWDTERQCYLVPVTNGPCALISPIDYPIVSNRNWYMRGRKKYPASGRGRTSVYLHQMIMGNMPGLVIDHINRDRYDSRRENLRFCTQRENSLNSDRIKNREKTSKYTGVYKHKCGRWRAQAWVGGTFKRLGLFKVEEDARDAYIKAISAALDGVEE